MIKFRSKFALRNTKNYLTISLSITVLVIFTSNSILLSQPNVNYIARAGKETITPREFRMRYELMPHLSTNQWNTDTTKLELLYSIIAEKLLAQEASRLGFSNSDYYLESIAQLKDIYLRDALYRREIARKVKISQGDIEKALIRSSQNLYVKVISAADSETIYGYYFALLKGASFDSIEAISDPVEKDSLRNGLRITYGQMAYDNVEDTLYSLNVGKFSMPVKTETGWFIFKLIRKDFRVPPNVNDADYNRSIIEVIRARKSRQIGIKYLQEFFRNREAVVDSLLFLHLAKKVSSVLDYKQEHGDSGYDGYLYLSEPDILRIMQSFSKEELNGEIVHSYTLPITLHEYLYGLIVYPFLVKDASPHFVSYALMDHLNHYIEYEFLAQGARALGLENEPEVREDVHIWADSYLAKMLKNTFRDSVRVSESELRKYFLENFEKEKVKLSLIINPDIDTLMAVYDKIKSGEDFDSLASVYNISPVMKLKRGMLPYSNPDSLGVLGRVSFEMKTNDVCGPIRTDSGYALIKLSGRKLQPKDREEVKIVEILTHSVDSLESVVKALQKNEDFEFVAKKYSEKNREPSFTPCYSLGEIGRIVAKLRIGQVYGPVATDSGYLIIKLVDRRYDTTNTNSVFEQKEEEIRQDVLEKKFNEKFYRYIAELSEKYGVQINYEALKKLDVINIPMFTYKYIGFGGKITAMPYIGPWYDWTKYVKNKGWLIP
ncbi:MAG: peptidylprolyl isomerase [Candidatus Kryptoniota bacterium]